MVIDACGQAPGLHSQARFLFPHIPDLQVPFAGWGRHQRRKYGAKCDSRQALVSLVHYFGLVKPTHGQCKEKVLL